jgi:hypothetical protein
LVYYSTSTQTELWGDIINSTIIYVQYTGLTLRANDWFQISVLSYFRSYPSSIAVSYSLAVFQNYSGLNIKQAANSGTFSFPSINANVFSITALPSDKSGTEIVGYNLNVSLINPYTLFATQSVLPFFDILNINIAPMGNELIFMDNT